MSFILFFPNISHTGESVISITNAEIMYFFNQQVDVEEDVEENKAEVAKIKLVKS